MKATSKEGLCYKHRKDAAKNVQDIFSSALDSVDKTRVKAQNTMFF